jgi:hypothetical protein
MFPTRLRRVVVEWCAAFAIASLASSALAQSVDTTCILPLTRTDPATVNVAFPDQAAIYWITAYEGLPGTHIRIGGSFPHARYMSFHAYDPLQRPITSIYDAQIEPGPGSTNPFLPGADRTADPRQYEAFIDFGSPPMNPPPNTIYTGVGQNGQPNVSGTIIYRIYIPDQDRDETGGVGLPQLFLEPTTGGQEISPVDCRYASKPVGSGTNQVIASLNGVPAVEALLAYPGTNPPTFRKFVNLPQGIADFFLNNSYGQGLRPLFDPVVAAGGSGGFLSNQQNAYVASAVSRGFGQVLALRAKAPTFPNTRPGLAMMPSTPTELRYFSMCQNEFFSQRFIACVFDEALKLDTSGFYTIVLSTPDERPSNAKEPCGVNWLPWGPSSEGVLILRNMLADSSFEQAIQFATYGSEAGMMQDYYPAGQYFADKTGFEALGCPPAL